MYSIIVIGVIEKKYLHTNNSLGLTELVVEHQFIVDQ